MKCDLIRFKKFFKKGEQVYVGFRGGDTHGYISKADDKGIYLIQLNHSKEYFYPWNKFEVICHAGFKIKEEKIEAVANLIMIDLQPQEQKYGNSFFYELYNPQKNKNVKELLKDFKESNFNFKIADKEAKKTMEKYFQKEWALYLSILFGKAIRHKDIKKSLERPSSQTVLIDKYGGLKSQIDQFKSTIKFFPTKIEITGKHYSIKIPICLLTTGGGFLNDIGDINIIGTCGEMRVIKPELPEGSAYNFNMNQYNQPYNDEDLQYLLNIKKGKLEVCSTVGIGDPYTCDDEMTMVDFKVWETEQGMLFANKHAEIYVN